ncbi:unnamed protein product, partial [Lampetra fluviatilis]
GVMAFLSVLHRHGQLSWNVPDPARYRKRSSVDLGSRFDGQSPRMEQVQGAVWAAEGSAATSVALSLRLHHPALSSVVQDARAWELLLLMLLPGSREPREMPCSRGHARGGCTRLFVVIVRAWSRPLKLKCAIEATVGFLRSTRGSVRTAAMRGRRNRRVREMRSAECEARRERENGS